MNDSYITQNQSTAMLNSPIVRVQIPEVATASSRREFVTPENQVQQNLTRIDSLQQATAEQISSLEASGEKNDYASLAIPLNSELESFKHKATDLVPKKVDGLIDSILQKFPIDNPVAITFVGCKTDGETDKIASDVAHRLADRRVGKVLLIDSNPNSRSLSSNVSLNESAGIGNVVCDEQDWKHLVHTEPASELDFLPFGNVNTAKTLRSRTAQFLQQTAAVYQFICVSAGLNESPIAKSFCNAADGIYLVADLTQTSHAEAKAVVDKFKLNNQPLIGCIALDGTQES